jgi:hypothetical protein
VQVSGRTQPRAAYPQFRSSNASGLRGCSRSCRSVPTAPPSYVGSPHRSPANPLEPMRRTTTAIRDRRQGAHRRAGHGRDRINARYRAADPHSTCRENRRVRPCELRDNAPPDHLWIGTKSRQFLQSQRLGTSPYAAAQTRMVSRAGIRLRSRESARSFKGIFCRDVSEFESFMPSHAVWSLWVGCGIMRRATSD